MKIIAVTDYKEKVFLGIEQADIIKKRIKENNAWENDYLLGVLWIDNCRYIQLSKNHYVQLDVSSKAARRCFYRALRKSPQNPRVFAAIGWSYIIHCPKPDYIKIRQFFERAYKSAPQDPFYAWCMLAVTYMSGEYEKLCSESPRISQDDPEISFLSQITYAFALVQRNEYGRAKAVLAGIRPDILCQVPTLDEAVWTLIEALYCIGEMEYAREIYATNQAGKMMIGSPCRKYFEEEGDETVSDHTGIWTGFMIVLEITRRILRQSNCSPEIVNIFSVSLRISFVVLVVLIFIQLLILWDNRKNNRKD